MDVGCGVGRPSLQEDRRATDRRRVVASTWPRRHASPGQTSVHHVEGQGQVIASPSSSSPPYKKGRAVSPLLHPTARFQSKPSHCPRPSLSKRIPSISDRSSAERACSGDGSPARSRCGQQGRAQEDSRPQRADPLLHHPPLRRRPPLARPRDRPRRANHLQLRDRDPQGQQGQVRAGQEDGAHQGGPRALLISRLPAQLRIHPAHALRRQRPNRRPRHHAGACRPRMLPQGKGHRTHAHDRPGRGRRQDHRRLRRRPRVQALQRHQGAAPSPPRRDQAILRGLQEEREQGGCRERLPAFRRCLRGHPALHGSVWHLHLRGPEEVGGHTMLPDEISAGALPAAEGCCRKVEVETLPPKNTYFLVFFLCVTYIYTTSSLYGHLKALH